MVHRLAPLALGGVVALTTAACGLGSEGLSAAHDGSVSTGADGDGAADDGEDSAVLPRDAGDGEAPGGDGQTGVSADAAADAPGARDAETDHADAGPDEGGMAADVQQPDVTSSCIGSVGACPLPAIPCCTVVGASSYGMCTPFAFCR
jgi:hypothetical protein